MRNTKRNAVFSVEIVDPPTTKTQHWTTHGFNGSGALGKRETREKNTQP
jgi:hypothetical protein